MKSFRYALTGIVVGILVSPLLARATPDPSPDPNATVVYLRTSCDIANSDAGESPMENCFENMGALNNWIYGRSNPSAKLLIDIGPGQFGGFGCTVGDVAGNVGGDLTFRGAGVGKTIVGSIFSGISHQGCVGTKWAFENMTITGAYGVVWVGRTGGETIWTNVLIQGNNASWYEQADTGGGVCNPGQGGKHLFFSSRLVTQGFDPTFGFLNRCGDDWFWGSEIAVIPSSSSTVAGAIISQGTGNRMHLYGSNVRVELPANATATSGGLVAIDVSDGAELHSHGVGIDVVAKPGWMVTALKASNNGEIHAFESSYFFGLSTTGITIARIVSDGGHVHAPFLWAQHPTPPAIQSVDGADTAVVTSGTSDNHPHMVVYDGSCASKWYDLTDKACRP